MNYEQPYRISFKELAVKTQVIVAQRSGVSLSKALAQVEHLKKVSKVKSSSKKAVPV